MIFEALGVLAILLATYFILSPLLGFPEHFENEDGGIVDANGSGITFYFFQTSWCGWSKKAWPHWKELKRLMDTRKVTYGGKAVNLVEVDGDESKDMLKRYHVEGFPSFRLQTPDQIFEYSGAPSVEKFRKFLTDVLGQELLS
jgi:thiol-disulfide isomerase/thioredoxin